MLFPSENRAGETIMVVDFRHGLARVAEAAKLDPSRITAKTFRHTYTAARLQSLDNGEPVSLYTVQRELGWGSLAMVERVYGHLGQTRDRTEGVVYLPTPKQGQWQGQTTGAGRRPPTEAPPETP